MPAYLSISFVCAKKNMHPKTVHDFCYGLLENGFTFLSGYWGYEEDSLSDIIAWNQTKLEENFEPGRTEPVSRRYKQILFAYGGFSEVRMFVLNCREEETFSFEIILPEDELIRWKKGIPEYDEEKIDGLVGLCEKLWQQPYVRVIQTELELSDPAPSMEEIKNGAMPGVEPFAILPKAVWTRLREKENGSREYVCSDIPGDGVVLRLPER